LDEVEGSIPSILPIRLDTWLSFPRLLSDLECGSRSAQVLYSFCNAQVVKLGVIPPWQAEAEHEPGPKYFEGSGFCGDVGTAKQSLEGPGFFCAKMESGEKQHKETSARMKQENPLSLTLGSAMFFLLEYYRERYFVLRVVSKRNPRARCNKREIATLSASRSGYHSGFRGSVKGQHFPSRKRLTQNATRRCAT
jgi:hypothetical protein